MKDVADLEARERRVLAWSVQAIIYSKTVAVKKAMHKKKRVEGKITVYRGYFLKLLAVPKPLRDQLIIELPTLMAFRTSEVCTARKEHVDFERGDMQVLDSKKHKFFTVPLDPQVAEHLDSFIGENNLTGVLFRPVQKAGCKGKNPYLSNTLIEYVWEKWCREASVPHMPPRMGRAYFAVNWHIVEGKSLIGLMDILRHDSLLSTQKYLSKIRCYEDVKAEFYRGKKWNTQSQCARFNCCPLATKDCYCHMFTPKIEVKKNEQNQTGRLELSSAVASRA